MIGKNPGDRSIAWYGKEAFFESSAGYGSRSMDQVSALSGVVAASEPRSQGDGNGNGS
jgi:hypothetical protein